MTVTATGRRIVILGDVRKSNIGLTEQHAGRSDLERPAGRRNRLSSDRMSLKRGPYNAVGRDGRRGLRTARFDSLRLE